jgi:hypothetical protein
MSPYVGWSFKSYRPRNISYGILQDNYFKNNNFVTLKGSSYYDNARSDPYYVLVDDEYYWFSDDNPEQSFTISLQSHLLKLKSISYKSCLTDNCAKDVDVYGSNEGDSWESVCKIREKYETFFENVSNVACRSNYPYKRYRLVHIGNNSHQNYRFPIRYLELFGDLFKINDLAIIFSCCVHQSRSSHLRNNILIPLLVS